MRKLLLLLIIVTISCGKEVVTETEIVYRDREVIVEVPVEDQTRINELQAQISQLTSQISQLTTSNSQLLQEVQDLEDELLDLYDKYDIRGLDLIISQLLLYRSNDSMLLGGKAWQLIQTFDDVEVANYAYDFKMAQWYNEDDNVFMYLFTNSNSGELAFADFVEEGTTDRFARLHRDDYDFTHSWSPKEYFDFILGIHFFIQNGYE